MFPKGHRQTVNNMNDQPNTKTSWQEYYRNWFAVTLWFGIRRVGNNSPKARTTLLWKTVLEIPQKGTDFSRQRFRQ
ncbi:MAG: hypothetical protein LBI18_05865 [Planctomycetaceae bacterium]|jgi:hypothetical protein|nr:hypothetical protein [Planctomycetaceae bacterium]